VDLERGREGWSVLGGKNYPSTREGDRTEKRKRKGSYVLRVRGGKNGREQLANPASH